MTGNSHCAHRAHHLGDLALCSLGTLQMGEGLVAAGPKGQKKLHHRSLVASMYVCVCGASRKECINLVQPIVRQPLHACKIKFS